MMPTGRGVPLLLRHLAAGSVNADQQWTQSTRSLEYQHGSRVRPAPIPTRQVF